MNIFKYSLQAKILIISGFVILAALFFIKEYAFFDPDLGWHIRMGEYILAHGIPKTDPLSYTMPDYPIIDLEWLTNILFAFLYKNYTVEALNILVTLSCFAAIFIQAQRKYLLWFFLPAFLGFAILFEFFGIRTQVISWLFFSLLIKFVYDFSFWQKYRYILPVFMLVWANIHGSFMLGNIVLVMYGCSLLLSRKATKVTILLIALSIGATLVTPYGFRLWHEVWIQSTDESLHMLSGEWMPIIFDFNLVEGVYFLIFFLLIYRYYKKVIPFNLFLTLLLFAAGCSSIRQIPFFVIASIPLFVQSLSYLSIEAKQYPYGEIRLQKAYSGFLFFIIIITIFLTSRSVASRIFYREDDLYPTHAVKYLQTHIPKKNLLSVVEWGGYLDLYLPQKKVFIDGRMDNWRLSNPGHHESSYIFGENRLLSNGELSLATEVKKYDIDTVLYYSPTQTDGKTLPYYYNTMIDLYLKHKTYSKYPSLPVQLKEDGFKIVYQDNLAAVYKKSK